MVCEKFKEYSPGKDKAFLLKKIQEIIKEYTENNLVLTCRQLHYQLVSRNITANTDKDYKALTRLITDARMSGIIDWKTIVDRNRDSYTPYYEDNITDAIENTLASYKLNRMRNQKVYLEVMIEKMAIYEIVAAITRFYSITLTGDKGNCSKTILYDISKRLLRAQAEGKKCIVLYIGDHDPSGLMMIDSITETLSLMGVSDFEFRPIALTYEQALKYNLPPNDVKKTDTNSPKYQQAFGEYSWECDALPTKILQDILEDEIRTSIDITKFWEVLDKEEEEKSKLKVIIENWKNESAL